MVGEGLEEYWGTRGGLDEDWRGIVGGLEENWRKDPSSVQLNELNGLDEMTIGRHHIDFASRFPPRQLGARTIWAGDQMKYVSRSGGDNTRHRGLEEDWRRI